MNKSRRDFLRELGCTFLTRTAWLIGAERLMAVNALAAPATGPSGYKAMVCVFLFGGNDANNVVVPNDPDGYAHYASTRQGIALAQSDLLAITTNNGSQYGFHPNLADGAGGNAGLHSLFLQKKAAMVVNTGTLIRPITRTEYRGDPRVRPYQLFSHSDQQTEWQTSYAPNPYPTGWAGRVADLMGTGSGFPTITSVAGVTVFSAGKQTRPLVLSATPTTPLNSTLLLKRRTDQDPGSALRDLLDLANNDGATLIRDDAGITSQALINSDILGNENPTTTVTFPNTSLGRQLQQVARVIKAAPDLGLTRQIFFCSLGGFDTHNNQGKKGGTQGNLLQQVSDAIGAFYAETVVQGVSSSVTTFTMSDFSRTFVPGGSGAGTGSDHGWGSHHFIVGDAVKGGTFYGSYPDLTIGGPNDTDDSNGRGRWIPTTGVDQYAATLALWFGVQQSDLSYAFPNIGQFSNVNLGFMS